MITGLKQDCNISVVGDAIKTHWKLLLNNRAYELIGIPVNKNK